MRRSLLRSLGLLAAGAAALLTGCNRTYYRKDADAETYMILGERMFDPRWNLPSRSVIPDERSRMYDFADPDWGPLPPDDPAAHRYMHHPYKLPGYRRWHRRGDLDEIDYGQWLASLPRDDEGRVPLDPHTVRELSLLNSREYQRVFEDLYLVALSLSLQRFEFDLQWLFGQSTFYAHSGNSGPPSESNTLTLNNSAGVRQNLAAGGQIIVDFANSFVFEFTGNDVNVTNSGLLFQMTQPLLRGAFRQVRLEGLTQAERDVLYAVRDFAHFRRTFYVDVQSTYLQLLRQLQGIRNQRANLRNLARSLEEHQELAAAGLIAPIRVDQVFQNYQQARFSLQAAELNLQTALDRYKVQLGLPPVLEVRLDDALLRRFELNDPRIDALRDRNEVLRLKLVQADNAPPPEILVQWLDEAVAIEEDMAEMVASAEADYAAWEQSIEETPPDEPTDPGERDHQEALNEGRTERDLADRMRGTLADVRQDYEGERVEIRRIREAREAQGDEATFAALRLFVGREQRDRLTDILVIQTQTRVYLIDLPVLELSSDLAVRLALANRLELMNRRAIVVDAYREVEVRANALLADLNVRAQAQLLTDPEKNNPIRFDASANRYNVGLEFDTPLIRLAERNAYRAAQITYQRTRRDWMLAEDNVSAEIRADLRDLEINRVQFEIARASLVAAARQVEQAQLNLRTSAETDSSLTQDLLGALQNLLNAKNDLISGWVNYEVSRMELFRDLDWMQLDAQGRWTNESDRFANALEAIAAGDPADPADEPRADGPGGGPAGNADSAMPPGASEPDQVPPSEPVEELPPPR